MRVALVAGETSGDRLGAGLVKAIRAREPAAEFVGVGGPAMQVAGVETWFDASELAVMGLAEVITHLPRLLRRRRQLLKRLQATKPDVFVGIDAPDFNIPVESRLHRAGMRTVHYVSPSVWAWRPGRAAKMAEAADRVLCLLPFEPRFYEDYNLDAIFVGHPLADQLPHRTDVAAARSSLGLAPERETLALLPGSRASEVERVGPVFFAAAGQVRERRPDIQFVSPAATPALGQKIAQLRDQYLPGVGFTIVDGQSQQAIAAADAVVVASGTATLEALLLKRPMVVGYRVAPATRWLLERFKLLSIDRFALPNLLSDQQLVPELMQDKLTVEGLRDQTLIQLDRGRDDPQWLRQCDAIHDLLRCNADERAAEAVLGVLR
ncbi:MAG: lipid-A-disaccharide synthase [Gammaproteobacteria bacterium]|nr:lipid-A-disaccharide synthase [Gammaproteobacteria bacterium]